MAGLPTRGDLHLKRKFFHAIFGCLFAYLRSADTSSVFVLRLSAVALLFCVGEFFRLNFPAFNAFQRAIFAAVMREHEQTQVSGIVFYLSGILFSAIFFSPSITVLSALVLGFADPAASAFGIIFGKKKFSGNKTLAGFVGFVIVSSVVLLSAHVILFKSDAFSFTVVKGCVTASLIGGLTELFSALSFALLAVSSWTGIDFDRF